MAPEKIENILLQSPLIGQIFVYGDSLQSTLVAVVVPDEEVAVVWSKENNMNGQSFADLCRSELLSEKILMDIEAKSRDNGLKGFETVKAIILESQLFSLENGLMTPTFKLKRPEIRNAYESQIAALYANMPRPRSKL